MAEGDSTTPILVADDDPVSRDYIGGILETEGYCLVTADNGRSAIELIDREQVRLALFDWEMPSPTGPELCRMLRAQTDRYVYMILVTSRTAREDLLAGLATGADDYVTKPVDPAELLLRVRSGERVLATEGRSLAIFALAKLADSRDPDTGAHLERTQAFCRLISEAMLEAGVYGDIATRSFIELIAQTSPLHDIGKIGIPDAVLLKDGRLDETEFNVMKRHTVIGAQTLGAALDRFPGAGYLRMARDIALCHHERWDGSGYPNGLARGDIPLSARVMAIADVYDALRSPRVYKPAMTHAKARKIIIEGSGSHFDPRLVELFEANHELFERLYSQLSTLAIDPGNRGAELAA